jgi:hypothetical protein
MAVLMNLHDKLQEVTEVYLNDNVGTFKSDVAGPQGPQGPQGIKGDQGISVHHTKGTDTTDSEGDFGTPGEVDTYTMYGDASETLNLGWYTVTNGSRGPIGDTGLAPKMELRYVGGDLVLETVGYVEASEQVEWSLG